LCIRTYNQTDSRFNHFAMSKKVVKKEQTENVLCKSPTGIKGFDEITGGGLPKGRPTLICGDAGCGKTLFSMEFLVRGATMYNEPGVFMSFEETEKELSVNVNSLGFDLPDLIRKKLLLLDHIQIERSEIEETGEFDLEGLFIRLNHAIDQIGAKRVVLDTIESLFSGLPNPAILRAELRRLFRWLKDKGVTAIITAERGTDFFSREGLEEYVSDCVILLDHRVSEQSSTRRLRILKYRGSQHGTNEYPLLIGETGFVILPITSIGLNHAVSSKRVSSGIHQLDAMLEGRGYYQGSSVLISGSSGTGKSSLAAHLAVKSCRSGKKVLYFSFEESPRQIIRNMRSIGIDLEPFEEKGLLQFHAMRPTFYGLEVHLNSMIRAVGEFHPAVVIVDPINSFVFGNNEHEAKSMAMRLIDYLKLNGITGLFTTLTTSGTNLEHTSLFISSLIDTWLLLRDIELGGERNRGMYILKSRGMAHSNQIREFVFTKKGVLLRDVYVGLEGVLTGSARMAQEAKERAETKMRNDEIERKKSELIRRKRIMEAQIESLRLQYAADEAELVSEINLEIGHEKTRKNESDMMAAYRRVD
jgi:circadian clock protein KaiC